MNNDFEKRLQRVAPRDLPSGWREEILTAARQAGTARRSSVATHSNPLRAFMDQLAAVLRPQRVAWATVGMAWLVILLLNGTGGPNSTTAMAASIPAAQARLAMKQKQFLMVELAGRTETREAVQPRSVVPGPRSQRREATAAA